MKIGFVSLPASGHLNPMTALARKMQARGHEVVFIGVPETEAAIRAANLRFVPFCEREYPMGSVAKALGGVAKLHGLDVVRYSLREVIPGLLEAALEHLPEKISETGVEALVLDTVYFFLELVPMRLGMPYVHIWSAHHLDFSGATPAALFSWPHETASEAIGRNVEGLKICGEILAPVAAIAKPYAEKAGLHIDWNDPSATISKLAAITHRRGNLIFQIPAGHPHFTTLVLFTTTKGGRKYPFHEQTFRGQPFGNLSGTNLSGTDELTPHSSAAARWAHRSSRAHWKRNETSPGASKTRSPEEGR